ncbi:MAG: HisA/HisF-related TIM barrel protein, partial [Ilumatobacteraceae bacterium]
MTDRPELFPAIDLREGRVVRLAKGDYDAETVYGYDPVAVARSFVDDVHPRRTAVD